MKQVYCEREAEIIQALRRGALDPELAKHAVTCAICADTLAVAEFLQTERAVALAQDCHSGRSEDHFGSAGLLREESRLDLNTRTVNQNTQFGTSLPDSDFLWWKAQLARKQTTVERATRSIALVKKVSYFGAAAAGLWLIFAPGHLGSILSVLSRQEIGSGGGLGQSALFLGVGALVFTLLGSLYLVRSEK